MLQNLHTSKFSPKRNKLMVACVVQHRTRQEGKREEKRELSPIPRLYLPHYSTRPATIHPVRCAPTRPPSVSDLRLSTHRVCYPIKVSIRWCATRQPLPQKKINNSRHRPWGTPTLSLVPAPQPPLQQATCDRVRKSDSALSVTLTPTLLLYVKSKKKCS